MLSVFLISLHSQDGGVLDRLPASHRLAAPCTVGDFLLQIGLDSADVDALWAAKAVAVFGVTARPDTVLHDGDRVEILDALRFNPMESRRRRAAHRQAPPKSRRRLV